MEDCSMNDIAYFKEIDLIVTDVFFVMEQTRVKGTIPKRKPGRSYHGFIYVMEGRAHYFFNDMDFYVNQGELLFLTKGSFYSYDIETDQYHFIYVDFDFVKDENINLQGTAYKINNNEVMENLFIRLNKEWFHKYPTYKLKCKSILYEIISLLFQNQASYYIPSSKSTKIRMAVSFMENNYTDKTLNISKLVGMVNMSEVHFRNLFKEIYRIPPVKYLNILRTGRAKDLLKETTCSISDIAEMTGYSDVYYFSKAFKKETGTSPSEYRILYEKGKIIIR